MKNIRIFYLKIFIFLVVKFSIYLNRHVFVMIIIKRLQCRLLQFCLALRVENRIKIKLLVYNLVETISL